MKIPIDLSNTPASKLTARIMLGIARHLKDDAPEPGQPTHYEAVYEIVKRNVLADQLVAGLPKSGR